MAKANVPGKVEHYIYIETSFHHKLPQNSYIIQVMDASVSLTHFRQCCLYFNLAHIFKKKANFHFSLGWISAAGFRKSRALFFATIQYNITVQERRREESTAYRSLYVIPGVFGWMYSWMLQKLLVCMSLSLDRDGGGGGL